MLKTRLCGLAVGPAAAEGVRISAAEPYASFPAVLGHEVVAEVVRPRRAPLGARASGWWWNRPPWSPGHRTSLPVLRPGRYNPF